MKPTHHIELFANGLSKLAGRLRGDEVLYSGIRPYGYHAGNRIAVAVYPHLLARLVAARGINPRFVYTITINDIEPLDYDEVEFKVLDSTFQFGSDVDADKFEKTIYQDLEGLRIEFPEVKVRFHRTSAMTETEAFMTIFRAVTVDKHFLLNDFLNHYYADQVNRSAEFAGFICRNCHLPCRAEDGPAQVAYVCPKCHCKGEAGNIGENYWMFRVPLIAMKLAVVQPNVVFLGSDYLTRRSERLNNNTDLDAILRLHARLNMAGEINFALPPILLGNDGRKMSKSLGNLRKYEYDELLLLCAGNNNESVHA